MPSKHPRAPSLIELDRYAAALSKVVNSEVVPGDLLLDCSAWVRQVPTLLGPCSALIYPNPLKQRRNIGAVERRSLVATFNEICLYCNRKGSGGRDPDGKAWSPDHFIPKSRGGSCNLSNIVLACEFCNYEKCDDMWLPGCLAEPGQLAAAKVAVEVREAARAAAREHPSRPAPSLLPTRG